MEEYETFARRRLAHLVEAAGMRDSARSTGRPVGGGSSCIRFHGVAVLPPVLTEQQRQLMRGYRGEAARLLRQRDEAQPASRVSQVQTLLDSVQLRAAPTLQEFIQNEPDVVGTGRGAWDSPLPLCSTAKPVHDGKRDEFSFHHLTSISSVTLDATDGPDLTDRMSLVPDTRCVPGHGSDVHQTAETRCQTDQHSLSSGYITSDNTAADSRAAATMEAVQLSKEERQAGSQESLIPLDTDCLAEGTGTAKGSAPASEVSLDTCPGPEHPGVCEAPRRMSLQNLLKQSQEYRRRQRQLRTAQSRSRETDETQSLSDKENNEVPLVERNELRKSKERRANHAKVRFSQFDPFPVSVVERPPAQTLSETPEVQSSAGTNLGSSEAEFDCGRVNVPKIMAVASALSLESPEPDDLVGDHLTWSTARDDPASDQSEPLTTTSSSAEPCGLGEGPKIDGTVPNHVPTSKKFTSFPTPQPCLSPVQCGKSRVPIAKLSVNTTLRVSANAGPPAHPKYRADQAMQISQLEVNLSRLQALINDLESTLDEGSTCEISAKGSRLWGEGAVPSLDPLGLTGRRQPRHGIASLSQKMRVPEMFRAAPPAPHGSLVLADASNGPLLDSRRSPSGVETPSDLWARGEEARAQTRGRGSPAGRCPGTRAKRRLRMSSAEGELAGTPPASHSAAWGGPRSSTPRAQTGTSARLLPKETQLHAEAPIKDQEREQLQTSCRLSAPWRPLVAAAVRGYLTRRLLRTEHVTRLWRIVKDSRHFLSAFRPGTADGEQDLELQKRVLLQLRAARYEIYDIVFSSSPAERMQIISWDRALVRQRELRRRENGQHRGGGRPSLSVATRRSLERRRGSARDRVAVEGPRLAAMEAGCRRASRHPRPSSGDGEPAAARRGTR